MTTLPSSCVSDSHPAGPSRRRKRPHSSLRLLSRRRGTQPQHLPSEAAETEGRRVSAAPSLPAAPRSAGAGVRGNPGRSRDRARPAPSGLSGGGCAAPPAEGALRPALRLRARGGRAPRPRPAIGLINLPRNGRRVIGEEKGCLRPPRPRPATPRAAPGAGGGVGTHSPRPGAAPAPTAPACPGHPFPIPDGAAPPGLSLPRRCRCDPRSPNPAGTGVAERVPSPPGAGAHPRGTARRYRRARALPS